MTSVRLPLAQACINKFSVVDMGEYCLYAGPDGLCSVSATEGSVVTKGLISREQWTTQYYPTYIKAFKHKDCYVAFYYDGGSVKGGWIYDPRGESATLSTLTLSTKVNGGWADPKTGNVYTIIGNTVYNFRNGTSATTGRWRSKKFVTPKPISFAYLSLYAAAYPATVKVYCDSVLIAHYTISFSGSVYTQATTVPSGVSNVSLRSPIMRLPAKRGYEWEVEISGTNRINEVCLGQSIEELSEA